MENDITAAMQAEIWTIAPFTIDLNFYSLTKTKEDLAAFQKALGDDPALRQSFDVSTIDWPFGYGTIAHDDIPLFFQPSGRLILRDRVLDDQTWGAAALKVRSSEVLTYDDGIAVLVTHWDVDPAQLRKDGYDQSLTDATNMLFRRVVYPRMTDLSALRAKLPGVLRDHEEYLVAREENAISNTPVWVARTMLVSGQGAAQSDHSWIDGLPDGPVTSGTLAMYVGSGNSVFTDHMATGAELRETWMRTMSMAQFYSVTLKRFQSGLLAELRTLTLGKTRRKLKKIVKTIERKLDHLEFFRLQHERAVYGLQGRRRDLYAHIFRTWDGDVQLRNAIGWAEFLRQKIQMYYQSRRMVQGRMLKGLIAAIGGLTFFELAVVLLQASETYKDDQVFGLLDLLHKTPADTLIMVTGGLLAIFAVIAVLEDRR